MAKNRQDKLRENYRRLRDAGFSSAEATRFRGASEDKIKQAIQTRSLPEKETRAYQARAGYRREYAQREALGITPQIQKGRIQYQTENHVFLDPKLSTKYNYVMAYQVRHPNGQKEWKYLTVASDNKLTKKDIINKMIDEYFSRQENMSKYASRPLAGSIGLVAAYARP